MRRPETFAGAKIPRLTALFSSRGGPTEKVAAFFRFLPGGLDGSNYPVCLRDGRRSVVDRRGDQSGVAGDAPQEPGLPGRAQVRPLRQRGPWDDEPYQHGEVFVTEDGAETDLDLGHYERFLDENLGRLSNVTTGSVYWEVIARERRGDNLGPPYRSFRT